MIRPILSVIILICVTMIVTSCGKGEQLQLEVQNALAKQTEMNNYRFSGSADLALGQPTNTSLNPLTARLAALMTNAKFTWEGVASVEPVRVELLLKLTPQNAQQSIDIPMLIQDNKLYVHIPAINEADQFYEIDLLQISQLSNANTNLSTTQLGDSTKLFSSSFSEIIGAIQPKRFEETTSKDDDLSNIIVTLEQAQVEETIDAWFQAIPNIIQLFHEAGYIQASNLKAWESKFNENVHHSWKENDKITLDEPLTILMGIDEEGFARELQINSRITTGKQETSPKTLSIFITNRYDDINQNPDFTHPIPTNIIPFTDILKLLSAQ